MKKNLKDEIDLLKKIVFNFSQYINNYNYISNFYYLDNYIHRKNENLEKFRNSFNFQDETKYLLDFFNNNNKIKEKGVKTDIIKLKEVNLSLHNYFIKEFTESLFFLNYGENVVLAYYGRIKNTLLIKKKLNEKFTDKIYSVSFAKNKKQIYACLLNQKTVKIFDVCEDQIKINECKIVDQPRKL